MIVVLVVILGLTMFAFSLMGYISAWTHPSNKWLLLTARAAAVLYMVPSLLFYVHALPRDPIPGAPYIAGAWLVGNLIGAVVRRHQLKKK